MKFDTEVRPLLHLMTIHDAAFAAIAASLDISHVQELAQLSEEAFWNYAHAIAGRGPLAPGQPTREEEYLECAAGRRHFLLPLSGLYEILPAPRRYTALLATPAWMHGLAAWRGNVIAVVDLALYLTGEAHNEQQIPLSRCLLVAHAGDVSLGLLVHSDGKCFPLEHFSLPQDAQHTASDQSATVPEETQVLDIPALLTDIVRQLENAASYG